MNPWAIILILLAIVMLLVAWKGTQDNVVAMFLGHKYGNSTIS